MNESIKSYPITDHPIRDEATTDQVITDLPIVDEIITDHAIMNRPEDHTAAADAQRQLEQSQHRLQRAENRKEYLAATQRKQRNHRLITRGAAVEHIFPEVKPLTEREFFELTEQVATLPELPSLIHEAVIRHNDTGQAPEQEAR